MRPGPSSIDLKTAAARAGVGFGFALQAVWNRLIFAFVDGRSHYWFVSSGSVGLLRKLWQKERSLNVSRPRSGSEIENEEVFDEHHNT